MRLFSLAFSFFVATAGADVRIIHGGGGYAEMQALSFFRRLPHVLEPCLRQSDACGIGPGERAFLHMLIARGLVDTKDVRLNFGARATQYRINAAGQTTRIELERARLYDAKKQPHAASRIGAEVLNAWFMNPAFESYRASLGGDERVMKLATSIAASVKTNVFRLEHGAVQLHALTLTTPGRSESFFALETRERSHDLTETLFRTLKCAHGVDGRLTRVDSFNIERDADRGVDVVHARVRWACGQEVWSGQLAFEYEFKDGRLEVRSAVTQVKAETNCGNETIAR